MSQADPPQSLPDDSAPVEPAETAGHETMRRPASVTAAAVIAFVLAVYGVVVAILTLNRADEFAWGATPFWYTMGILVLILAGLMGWGGIAALRGTTTRILGVTALVFALVLVFAVFIGTEKDVQIPGIAPASLLVVVMALSLTAARSKDFFVARRGPTP